MANRAAVPATKAAETVLKPRHRSGSQNALDEARMRFRHASWPRLGRRENKADADGIEAVAVDEDEAAGLPTGSVGIEGQRPIQGKRHVGDVVGRHVRCRMQIGAVRIDAAMDGFDPRHRGGGAELDVQLVAAVQSALAGPEEPRAEAGSRPAAATAAEARTLPRETSTASARTRVTDWPAMRRGRGRHQGDDAGDAGLGAGGLDADPVADRQRFLR